MDTIRVFQGRGRALISDIASIIVKFEMAVDELSCKYGMDIVGK